ncbi:alpha/beta fold hydrolase [Zestomonas carbonaria]|uniref:3-oxoadipate enol-lactonase 2 n=1 Tax=Zestomonas carbonaria TaxID=2762745 RepID=A0A7U7EQB8_9GAMM|nr:alpha/beta hydrolase [Pseudomonas carbonaria]CAD5108727.1 3-oxoadipate enol-lactonase 2 [Pseudomonas carbonaria]
MSYFDYQGCQLHYEEYGHGAPLLLVHGLGSSTLDWEYQIPALSPHYRVIALDVRGHGRSGKPRERYSIAGFAEDVAALIEHLGCGPVHLVGISMGGMIGFQVGVDFPHLLKSLTIVNSGPEVKARKPADYLMIAQRWTLSRLLSLERIAKGLARILFPKPEQAELRQKVEQRWPRNDKRAYTASLDAIIGWGVRERLERITCPTLVVSADHDYTPVALKEAYVKELPNARLAVIADSRHATPMDQPERFNTTLLDFLAEVERSAKT